MSDWSKSGDVIGSGAEGLNEALELAHRHNLQIYDALILAAAAGAGCEMLISEDMQNGFKWGGLAIANPFLSDVDPRLVQLIR